MKQKLIITKEYEPSEIKKFEFAAQSEQVQIAIVEILNVLKNHLAEFNHFGTPCEQYIEACKVIKVSLFQHGVSGVIGNYKSFKETLEDMEQKQGV